VWSETEHLAGISAKILFEGVVSPEMDEHGQDAAKANHGKDAKAEIPSRHGLAQIPRLSVGKVVRTERDHQPVQRNRQDRYPRIVTDEVVVVHLLVVNFPSGVVVPVGMFVVTER
jgi:hypothetical protein